MNVRKNNTTHCIICKNEKSEKERRFSKKYCKKCYVIEFYKKNPNKHEERKKYCRDYNRKKKGLSLELPLMKNENGKGHITKYGYKSFFIPDHPNARKHGSVYEHVLIMSNYLKRPLIKGEIVHHKNGNRLDNRIDNLELWNKAHPPGQRVKDRIEYYIQFLEQYGYEVKIKCLQTVSKIGDEQKSGIFS